MNQLSDSKLNLTINDFKVSWLPHLYTNSIHLTLEPGNHLYISGRSGAGKSILGKAIAGQVFHTGSIEFYNDRQEKVKPTVTYIDNFQKIKNRSNLVDHYYQQRYNSLENEDAETVLEYLQQFATAETALYWVEKFSIAHRQSAPLIQLSSGELKRLQLIKALIKNSEVIILDEPFEGLDVKGRAYLNELLTVISRNCLIILISGFEEAPAFITHYLDVESGNTGSTLPAKNNDDLSCNIDFSFLPDTDNKPVENPVIRLSNVTVKYGNKTILDNLNWQVNVGEKWQLKGANGSGKSTLLSLITGDNPQAYANDIILFGKKRGTGESIWDIKKPVGFVSPELLRYFNTASSCKHVVASGFFDTIGLFKKLDDPQKKVLESLMTLLGLNKVASLPLYRLPIGKQRLALIGRALIKNPDLLILDEPCQGLDNQQKQFINNLVSNWILQKNKTLIYVTHNNSELPQCINRIFEL
ncbi:ATP-binding cassette domain-containing protein [Polluticaenibacter yanchengensis]|uniref:ATP-binding cassette domain-containing protein n=1 Tax=Polluticaenibacter yanchengensis TaxID=3014562 RepID=A0ABT4UF90_9BACT|nr:ATP-binding cassette domain-containing protein [Chitinophagaceae bacterium LY-5]